MLFGFELLVCDVLVLPRLEAIAALLLQQPDDIPEEFGNAASRLVGGIGDSIHCALESDKQFKTDLEELLVLPTTENGDASMTFRADFMIANTMRQLPFFQMQIKDFTATKVSHATKLAELEKFIVNMHACDNPVMKNAMVLKEAKEIDSKRMVRATCANDAAQVIIDEATSCATSAAALATTILCPEWDASTLDACDQQISFAKEFLNVCINSTFVSTRFLGYIYIYI